MSLNLSTIQPTNNQVIFNDNSLQKKLPSYSLKTKEDNTLNIKDLGKIEAKTANSSNKTSINILDKDISKETIYPTKKADLTQKNNSPQDVYYVNGILTGKKSAEKAATTVADLVNKPVNLIYNPSEGFINDVVEASLQVMNIHAPQKIVDKTSECFYDTLKSGKELKVVAHSQGAAITAQALTKIETRFFREGCSKEEVKNFMKKVTVVTMGGASCKEDYSPNVKFVEIKNEKDLVPKLASKTGIKRTEDSLGEVFEKRTKQNEDKLWSEYLQKSDQRTLGKISVAVCGLTEGAMPILSEYISIKSNSFIQEQNGKTACADTSKVSIVDVINKYHSNYLADSKNCKTISDAIS
ncbi:MAG: hypothetical protein AABZ74_00690 [Cyanobacteriota bacterium]